MTDDSTPPPTPPRLPTRRAQLAATAAALREVPPTLRGTRASRAAGQDVREGTVLRPWMRAYAEWLMLEAPADTRIVVRVRAAKRLSRLPIAKHAVLALETRPDFVAYCSELQAGPLEAARTRFAARFPEYVDAHYDALKLAQTEGDYRAVAQIAEPVLDRVFPKKGDAPVAATQVNITLTPEQAVGMAVEYAAPVVEVEAPEAPAVLP